MVLDASSPARVLCEDVPVTEPGDAAALIEEARRERRRRYRRYLAAIAVLAAVAAALGLILLFAVGGNGGTGAGHTPAQPAGAPTSPTPLPAQTVPAGTGVVGAGPTSVDFTDALHGWIATGNLGLSDSDPTIVRTSDGGTNWVRTPVPNLAAQSIDWQTERSFGGLVGIHFANAERGWYFQSGIGWQTNDGGTKWATLHLPVHGALVALTSSGRDVWALVDGCPIGAVSCPQDLAKGSLYHAISAPTLTWHRVEGTLPAGIGSLYPRGAHSVIVGLGYENYRRSMNGGSQGQPNVGCESVGPLRAGRLGGICGAGGGGDASVSTVAVSDDNGATWKTLAGGPPSSKFIGALETDGADAIFYVTGGQTLWRTTTSQPAWRSVLQVPYGSTDEIYPVALSGSHGYALISGGQDAHWFETNDDGVTWEPVTLP